MQIYIPKQVLKVNQYEAWLLRKIGIEYAVNEAPLVTEKEVTNKETSTDNTPILMSDAIKGLNTRAHTVVLGLLHVRKILPSQITVKEFAYRFSATDLLEFKNCGKKTVTNVREMLESYGYKLRK